MFYILITYSLVEIFINIYYEFVKVSLAWLTLFLRDVNTFISFLWKIRSNMCFIFRGYYKILKDIIHLTHFTLGVVCIWFWIFLLHWIVLFGLYWDVCLLMVWWEKQANCFHKFYYRNAHECDKQRISSSLHRMIFRKIFEN